MYCILHPDFALRSWSDFPFAAVGMGNNDKIIRLSTKEFAVLIQADGTHDIEETETTEELLGCGLLIRCEKGERSLLPTQNYMLCDNYFIAGALFEITYRCNMKCKHCFIYSDSTSEKMEMAISDFNQLLDGIFQCGIKNVALTGGEPLLHKEFPRILDLISDHHMTLVDLYTNGVLLDDAIVEKIVEHGFPTKINISFDGIGYHDSLRGMLGSEQKVLEAIKRSVDKGFHVKVNVNVNEDNKAVISKTLDTLDEIGVSEAILIRTSESPRWLANKGRSMTAQDYYDYLLELLKAYTAKPRSMNIRIAHIMGLDVPNKELNFTAISSCAGSCVNVPVCSEARHMLTIGATGNVYPCPEISGVMDMMGVELENALEQPIQGILREGKYADWMNKKSQERIQHSAKCRECQYSSFCLGGCPAISCVTPDHYGDFWNYNPWQCTFFEGNYASKFINALAGYRCTNPGIDTVLKFMESK